MQTVLETFSQAASLFDGFFADNSTNSMNSLASISSFGALTNAGISDANFSYSAGKNAVCVAGQVEVSILADTTIVSYPGPTNNYELTEFLTSISRRDLTAFATYVNGSSTISDTFNIFAKLCVPADEEKTHGLSSVQFLTHGGTTDYTYWDFTPDYSYVDAAAEKGYATFSYDRLSTGNSDHPDPKQVVQAPVQVEVAHALVQKLKSSSIGNIKFTQVVGVGHSLGSALTQGVSSKYPEDFDALVLTGHSAFFSAGISIGMAAGAQQIANTLPNRPDLNKLPNGYITLGSVPQALQFAFFLYPFFDEKSKSGARTCTCSRC